MRLKPFPGHRLWLRFSTGEESVHDLSAFVAKGGPMVGPLKDEAYFARAFIEMGVPT